MSKIYNNHTTQLNDNQMQTNNSSNFQINNNNNNSNVFDKNISLNPFFSKNEIYFQAK